jgi:pyridoxal biosynthesis lyase PdxS
VADAGIWKAKISLAKMRKGGAAGMADLTIQAEAIVKATTHYNDPEILAQVFKNLGEAMPGYDIRQLKPEESLTTRGW